MISGMNGIQHIGIPVADPSRSIQFYKELGFSELMYSPYSNENGSGECWMFGMNSTVIELYRVPEVELQEVLARKDGHIDHIAFDVDNIEDAFKSAMEMGLHVIESSPVRLGYWKKGCRYFNVIGPSGERIEFCEIIK